MSRPMKYLLVAMVVIALAIPTGVGIVKANIIPTFDIVSIVPNEVVTIETNDFPADKEFDVLIGRYGTYGVDGIKVTTQNSGKGGTFTATFKIPVELKNVPMLSIRLEDHETGYYAYNWFENIAAPAPVTAADGTADPAEASIPVEVKHPNFTISNVVTDKSVTVKGQDFPTGEEFTVLMGIYGTYGMGGEKVTTQKTGEKGEFKATYDIPESFKGAYIIAVRIENETSAYYAFNYFYNSDYVEPTLAPVETKSSAVEPTKETAVSEPSYTGYPSFTITAVKMDESFSVKAENLPPMDKFVVVVADVNGDPATTFTIGSVQSEKGGVIESSFDIPEELKGVGVISVRMASEESGYFSYNYFYNMNYPVVEPTVEPTVAPTAAPTAKPTVAATKAPEPTTAPTPAATPTK